MSIAEKLTTIAENVQRVFEAGKEEGFDKGYIDGLAAGEENGKLAEYDRFWDAYQNSGAKKSYIQAFSARGCWTMDIYNPKYPILATSCESLFTNGTWLTDTLVPISMTGTLNYAFSWCTELETIMNLTVAKGTTYTNTFNGCSKLENITFGGSIGKNINFADCVKLTNESLVNILEHLYDYAADGDTSTYTCTLETVNLNKLTDTEKAIATEKGWTLA